MPPHLFVIFEIHFVRGVNQTTNDMNILGYTTDNTVTTGPVAQKDFRQYGRIEIMFHVSIGRIGLSIAGFSTNHVFYLNPTPVQKIANNVFYNKYVVKFSKREEFDFLIKDFEGCL